MKKLLKVIVIILLIMVVIFVGGYIWFYFLTRNPLPVHDGEMVVAGLNDRVEVLRDEWGIPHIYASNRHDLFFAQGYTQAQDRWWQMEFFRHTGSGAIEEITGKDDDLLATDIFLRTLGWRQVAERELEIYDEDTLAAMQSFTDGVNAYITSRKPGELALEYGLLKLTGINVEVKPWTVLDTLVFAKIMAWQMGPQDNLEKTRSELYDSIGQEMTDRWLTPFWPYDDVPTILQPEDLPNQEAVEVNQGDNVSQVADSGTSYGDITWPDILPDYGLGQGIGSNSWVVSGELTVSGFPLLANDPHLGIQMPSIWYEIGLHCSSDGGEPSLDVVGFAFSTSPGIIIGHNDSIAWGFTNIDPDVFDLYRIKVNPDNELQYQWNGQWRNMTVRTETINFGDGEESIIIQVRETHLGPIINDNQLDEETGEVLGFNNEDPMALCWTALAPGMLVRSIRELNEAGNWTEFRDALSHWDAPAQNIIYADIEGNIGYQMPGRIPIRSADHTGLVPVPGWTDEYEWQGMVPYDHLPRIFNPERGYITAANQPVVPVEYYEYLAQELGEGRNYVFSREWNHVYRAERIGELLEENMPCSISNFQKIQADNKLLSAEELIPYLAGLHFADSEVSATRDWLMEWDCQCNMDSPHAALYASFWASLVDNIFTDQIGEDGLVYGIDQEMGAIGFLMQKPDNSWWDDIDTGDVTESRDDILLRSFQEAYTRTVDELGRNRSNWRWGDIHTATFVSNPLGLSGIGLVENMVNRGPVAVGGNTETINNTTWVIPTDDFTVVWLSSMRMIVDFSDFTRSLTVHTTGQSGHPYSEHYDDMIDDWRNVEYHQMLWTQRQVDEASVNRLILLPDK